jgi:predicted dehydrogenase
MGKAWVGALKGRTDVQVVAIVDILDEPLAEAGEALGVPAQNRFKDLARAIAAVQADAVLTVTPPAVHIQHAKLAFDNGLHLLTEKPIAADLAQAKQMVEMAEKAGRILMVAQNYRYSGPMQTLMRLVREQPVGPLGHGHIDFYIPGDFRGSFRQTMEFPLLVDMAIHHIDLIRAVTGKNITKVRAQTFRPAWSWYDHHPGLNMLLELDGGMPFSYSGDWSGRGRNTTWNGAWRLQCEHGSIELLHDGKLLQATNTFWDNDKTSTPIDSDKIAEQGQAALLTRFVQAIETNTPPETSGRDNLWSFAAVTAGVISSREGRRVDVGELLNG